MEISHHQPSCLPDDVKDRIRNVVPIILEKIGYCNGASNIDMKLSPEGKLYFIEINPRGGGNNISNFLVESGVSISQNLFPIS